MRNNARERCLVSFIWGLFGGRRPAARFIMIYRMYWVAVVALMALPVAAQDRGVLAIDEEAGRHAFSFDSEADAVNMCGTTGCEVVATFSACLAVAYSRVTAQQEQSVWSWIEADTEGAAGREALDDCERSGGAACEVLNVYCVAASRGASATAQQAAAASPEQETVFWQSIVNSTNAADFEAYLAQFPNGVFRLLAQNRLAALRAPAGDAPVAGGPRGGGAGTPTARARPAADRDAPLRAGETRVFDGMEFVWVPAGEFRMGSTRETFVPEGPVTQVRISRGFWMGQHEVTQAQWQEVKGTNPSGISECGRSCPVEQMSWNDAQEFIGRMNAHAGGNRYRLPTEAEWEYAARAGTTGDRYGNLDAIAWYRDNSGPSSKPVGQKAPNAWGLHDMLGNVHEWVADWYGDYPGGTVTDPQGPVSGSYRVFRGGSWSDDADEIRASYRCYDRSAHCIGLSRPGASVMLGFRLLRME